MFRTVLSAAVLVVLASCSSSGSGSSDAGSSDEQRTAEAGRGEGAPAYDIERYVALGDSYTAAPLIAGKMSNDGCFRSSNNYPSLVAAELEGATFVDRSCGGATTRDMAGRQDTGFGRVPPQFGALTADTDLVTIGIGGNDFGVFGSLIQGCPGLRRTDPTGSPCRDYFSGGGRDELLARATRVQGRVTGVLRQIAKRAPGATVVVVDYPRITPRSGTCPRLLPLATGDYRWAGQVNDRLSRSVRRAARRAGATYVDVQGASAGHDICSDDPWVNGQKTIQGKALAYHPFAEEQRAVADLVLEKLG